jgi:hypothetical protein
MPIDKLTDNEITAKLRKYTGKKIICPKCFHIAELDLTFGYAICRHDGKICIFGRYDTDGIFEFLDELVERGIKRKRKRK